MGIGEGERGVRTAVEAVVIAEIERVGPVGFRRAKVVSQFKDKVPQSTLYRWIDTCMKSGRPGQHLAKAIKAAAAERAQRTPDPAVELAAEAATTMPVVVGIQDIVQAGSRGSDVIKQVSECIRAAQQVLDYARTADGGVRVPKLLLAASDNMRRGLETAVRLQGALKDAAEVERFHDDILATIREVAKEHPVVAELLLRRLETTAQKWV